MGQQVLNRLGMCLLIEVLTGASVAMSQAVVQPSSLLLEAEHFKPARDSAWKPIRAGEGNYYFATLANTFISRQKLLSAPEQCQRSEAVLAVDLPAGGTYRVWTRYELPSRWRVEHTLKIEQGGRALLNRIYGRTDSPKLWPFGKGIVPMVDWDWGSGDNVVWESSDPVALSRGRATFTLIAEKQEGEALPDCRGAAKRNVDCVYLTTDLEDGLRDAKQAFYHRFDKHLCQRGDLWIRVTNPKEGKAPVWVALDVKEHNPYWQKRNPAPKVGAQGDIAKDPTDADWIEPGKASPWVAIGQALDTTNWQELILDVNYKASQGESAPLGHNLVVEFARDAEGTHLLRKATVRHDEVKRAIFEVPCDVREAKTINTVEEMHRDLLAYLKKLPAQGRVPQQIPVYGVMGGNWHGRPVKTPDEFYRLRTEAGLLLGRNTWKPGEVPDDLAKQYGIKPLKNLEIDVRGVPTPQLEDFLKKGDYGQVLVVSMGDEIGVGGYAPDDPKDQQQFRDYLSKLQGMSEAERVRRYAVHTEVPATGTAKLTKDPSDGRNFYWSQLFSIDRGIDELKERTDIVEKVLGEGAYTGANYSPHPQYWPKVGQWVRLFRRRGMTMPWTEDWIHQIPELSPQVMGYLTDVLRCAAKYENMPIQVYTMPHYPGQTPRDLTLSFYSTLAHGNKIINFFAAVPVYDYTENYVAWEALGNWKAVRSLVHEVGMADDLLWNGKVRPAQVAILLSHTTDLYDEARGSSIYNFERKNLYFALRHAQVPVDFLTEEDVVEGWLEGNPSGDRAAFPPGAAKQEYKVLYVCGDHMLRACADRLCQWVKEGGHLVSVAGGGFLDEYDQPLDMMKEVYGIAGQKLTLTEKNLSAKEGLAWVKPLGEVRLSLGEEAELQFPALIALQELTLANGARVTARLDDGRPIGVTNEFGAGRAQLLGTFPATAYVQKAIPKRPYDRGGSEDSFSHFLPTAFLSDLRSVLAPAMGAVRLAVRTSEALVDATVIEAPRGLVVPMANFSGKSIKALTVTVPDVPEFKELYSVKRGELRHARKGSDVTVTLPLEWADMIVIRR